MLSFVNFFLKETVSLLCYKVFILFGQYQLKRDPFGIQIFFISKMYSLSTKSQTFRKEHSFH